MKIISGETGAASAASVATAAPGAPAAPVRETGARPVIPAVGADRVDRASTVAPSGSMSHAEFRSARYFPELDGLRAVSILLVVAVHTTDPVWLRLHGTVGVTVFFVISGFIITTLLVREEAERGRVRIGAFYARRAFRILPVYYVVLVAYILLVGVLRLQAGASDLWRALPYFVTFQNDLAQSRSGFAVTWSLAIEEKFYLVWPLFFVVAAARKHRRGVLIFLAVAVLPFAVGSASSTASMVTWHYPAIYAPIIDGCLVALVLHSARGYALSRRLTGSLVTLVLLVAAVAEMVLLEDGESNVHVVFALLVSLALPACLTGPQWLRGVLRSRVLVYIGTRSYALYLVHRLGKGVIDRVVAPGGDLVDQLLRFALITGLALLGAEVLRRTVEQPMIRVGRRLTSRNRTGQVTAALAPAVDRPEQPVESLATVEDQRREGTGTPVLHHSRTEPDARATPGATG